MTSLDELRSIQQERIADERAAFERERAAELDARRTAERAAIAAEETRVRQEREDQIRIETARANAEREVRLRVEAAEAVERARLHAALETRRLDEEVALRRAEVAKKRPTWMIAVTGLALCAGVALAGFAIARGRDADESAQAEAKAQHDKELAVQEARESRAELDKIHQNLEALDAKVQAAEIAVRDAQTEAERKRALHDIDEANRQKAEQKRELDDAKAKHDAWIRKQGLHPDKKCLDTAIGCIDH